MLPEPKRTRASIEPDRLPFISLRTNEFLLASVKPISRREAILALKASSCAFPTDEPKTREALLTLGGESGTSSPLRGGDIGAAYLSIRGRVKVADADRRAKPNLLPGFGGNGGGWSSDELTLAFPVLCDAALRPAPPENSLNSYLRRMKRSMTPPASSTSTGISGLVLLGLYFLFDTTLPIFFMFWWEHSVSK